MNKINLLSIAVLSLVLFNLVENKNVATKTFDVGVFIEGDKANLARVADLLVDYDKNNLELVSSSAGGFLVGSSNIKKDEWVSGRSLQMSTSTNEKEPILRLKFRGKKNMNPPNIRLSSHSTFYLSQIGVITLPSDEINYRIKYD